MDPREELAALRRLAELEAKAGTTAAPLAQITQPSRMELLKREVVGSLPVQTALGAVRGAGSIGATLMAPFDAAEGALERLAGAPARSQGLNAQRRQDMTGALQNLGADTSSVGYNVGKIGGEIAGTLGVGPALATAAGGTRLATAAPSVVDAVRTAGMTAGGRTGLAALPARVSGGAVTGGASAALVNPEDAAMGAGIGAALPPVLAGLGKAGGAIGRVFQSRDAKTGGEIARALDLKDPAAVQAAAAQLRAAQELVPGSRPTVAQVLQTPQASILERVIQDSAGGGALQNARVAQGAARRAAIDAVAPVNPSGFATAQNDTGAALRQFYDVQRKGAKAATRAAYEAVPQDETAFYLPNALSSVRDKYFGRGAVEVPDSVSRVLKAAESIGTVELPALRASTAAGQAQGLAQAVRRAGGIRLDGADGLRGEIASLSGDVKNLVRRDSGMTLSRMAQKMNEAGFLPDQDVNTLIDALRSEARGGSIMSATDSASERFFAASRDAAMGAPPEAGRAPVKVTLREFDRLRRDIGGLQRQAGISGKDTEAAALGDMKRLLDERIDEVVRGDGAIDEVLPLDWANKLTDARKLKIAEVDRFKTGPQAAMARRGSDGAPKVQGGEAAALFWGQRPGLADDVKAFRKLIADQPQLLGQFRSMVTTQGDATAGASGMLGDRFVRWFDNMRPGLSELLDPAQLKMLERVSQDVQRATTAANAGRAVGSNTYQNAQNALDAGLLGSPVVRTVAGRVPFLGAGVDWLAETATRGRAERLANALADPAAAANALQALSPAQRNALQQIWFSEVFGQNLLRATPVGLAGGQ